MAADSVAILCHGRDAEHWHFIVRPTDDDQVSQFFRRLTVTHTMRWHVQYHTSGTGHLYQGCFKLFPVQADEHLLMVMRYVERNPLRANRSNAPKNGCGVLPGLACNKNLSSISGWQHRTIRRYRGNGDCSSISHKTKLKSTHYVTALFEAAHLVMNTGQKAARSASLSKAQRAPAADLEKKTKRPDPLLLSDIISTPTTARSISFSAYVFGFGRCIPASTNAAGGK